MRARKTTGKRDAAPDTELAVLRKRIRDTERTLSEVERRYQIVMAAINKGAYDWDIVADRVEIFESMHRALGLPAGTLQAGDRAHFKRCAHKLAGSFAMYGFAWAAAQCRAMKLDAQRG